MTIRERSETHAGCPRCDGTGQIPIGGGLTRACDYYGNGRTFLTAEDREDSPVPPETYRRRDKELSNSPKNILQRKYQRERSQRRRDALKRMQEET